MKRNIWSAVIGVLLMFCGIFCLFSPVETSAVLPYLVGISLTMTGIGKVIRWKEEKRYYGSSAWNLAGAAASLLFGLLLVLSPALQLSMASSVIMLIAAWVTVMGTVRIIHAFRLRNVTGYDIWGRPVSSVWQIALLPGILMVILGILNLLHPEIALGMIGALIGFILIAAGSSLLSFGRVSWIW